MGKLGYIVLGLALLVGALSFAGYRHFPQTAGTLKSAPAANRTIQAPPSQVSQQRGSKTDTTSLSGVQLFEMGLNVANVVVGLLGFWMAMRGFRAERRAEAMAMRRDR